MKEKENNSIKKTQQNKSSYEAKQDHAYTASQKVANSRLLFSVHHFETHSSLDIPNDVIVCSGYYTV